MASKKKNRIVVDVCVSNEFIVARDRTKGRWGMLQGQGLRKARRLTETSPSRDIGSPTTMKEFGSIEISEDDWIMMP